MSEQIIIEDMPEEINPIQEVLVDPHTLATDHDLADEDSSRPYEQIEATHALESILDYASDKDKIDKIDKRVIVDHFGVLGHEQVPTFTALGQNMGVGSERVRQREVRGIKNLQNLADWKFK